MQTQLILYLFLLGIYFAYGLVKFSQLTSPYRLVVLLIGYTFCSEVINRFVLYYLLENTFLVYHLNAVILIVFYLLIYLQFIQPNPKLKQQIVVFFIVSIVMALLNSLWYKSLWDFPSFSIAANAFFCISLSLILFKKMLDIPTNTRLFQQPVFWFNLGTLTFYSFNFIGFVFHNEYYKFKAFSVWLNYLNWIGNLLLYTFYFVAIYLNQKAAYER